MTYQTKNIKVIVDGNELECPPGTRYWELIRRLYPDDKTILLVREGNVLRELRNAPKGDIAVSTVSAKTACGIETYRRSVTLLFMKAWHDVVGSFADTKVKVQFSVSKGYYCEVKGKTDFLDEVLVCKLRNRMKELVAKDIFIEKLSLPTAEAIQLFEEAGMQDKARLFRFRRASQVNLYQIEDYVDYFYGYMVPSTGYLPYFELYLYENGIVLQMPVKSAPDVVLPFEPQKKVTASLLETVRFAEKIGVKTVADLNEKIVSGDIQDLILVEEALQEKKISEIAHEICARKNIKFVMIAGPSSSGKTSFSHRLSIQLKAHGLCPQPIAVDNYFVNRVDNPRDEFGNYNFEDLESIDTERFDQDMNALLRGDRVELPYYNFVTGCREYKGNFLQLDQNGILVIEGIHCLNEKLYATLPKENMYKIYISALTQLNIDEHNRVSTTDGRLIRRMARDAKHRGITVTETLSRWESVRRGEEKNIFPYQETADVVFNSAQIYELSILKLYVEPLLFGVPQDAPEYMEANRLLKMLDYFLPLLPDYIPSNSILQEFMGHSIFDV